MNHHDTFTESMVRKISEVQLLIRRTYGPGFFAEYAGWSERHVVGMEYDRNKRRHVLIFNDGSRG